MRFLRFISNLFKHRTERQKGMNTIEASNDQSKKLYTHLSCTPGGVYFYNGHVFVPWTCIERIETFKTDLLTTDCILLEITHGHQKIVLSEESEGWAEFIDAVNIYLPTIKKDWYEKLVLPPFETNLVTIYNREDRIMPENNNCYAELMLPSTEIVIVKFQQEGWSVKKCSFTDFEMRNNWSELTLAKTDNELLLHGAVAFHQDNINIIKNILDSFDCGYNLEFYQEHVLAVQFKK